VELNQIQQFNFSLHELSVDLQEVEELAGIDASMPSYATFLKDEIDNHLAHSEIKGGYIIKSADLKKEAIKLEKQVFNTGLHIANKFKGSSHIAVFACTAGCQISDRINELNAQAMLIESYLLDVLGSIMVEKAMDKIQDLLENQCYSHGLGITNRYSPGYINWHMAEQKALFEILPKQFCGIKLSDSCLMMPVKSISGFIGIGKNVRFQKHECQSCNSQNCLYRHSKNHC